MSERDEQRLPDDESGSRSGEAGGPAVGGGLGGRSEESEHKRLSRNVSDLVSEVRVAQGAVQILFGFLLSIVFTSLFRQASGFEKILHMIAVVLAAGSTALLTAPPVWHRILFRTGSRAAIVRAGNRSVLAGLFCLAAAIIVVVALISKVVFGFIAMGVVGGAIGALFCVLWFVVPGKIRK